MQLTSKFNKGIRFLACDMGIFSNYAWVIPLKDIRGIKITVFRKIFHETNHWVAKPKGRKPNKIWVDKGRKFYNKSIKSWLAKNGQEMY